ncbi:MAG: putative toxin-antitoxin system toxin component, PIN family [Dysgonamonadaceae bacterium]|jgi:putative PIN family toxin of toxin-antitoxin system|nr:putative toxin-antitoxin system toxin component, PIN family [Dysgonamonadaceae bacterium]
MNVIIDTNLWISFLIGKRLSVLKSLLTNPDLTIFVCGKLLEEIQYISSKQKIRKYVGNDDIRDTLVLIDRFCKFVVIQQDAISPVRDIEDLYLLSLADTVRADYIITGDKDLLILHTHNQTKIVTYNDFAEIVGKQ